MPKHWVSRVIQNDCPSELDWAIHEGSLPALREVLQYGCDLNRLGTLAPAFLKLSASARTLDFLRSNPPHSMPAAFARTVAGWFLSNTDANAALSMYRMHVLDIHSAALLLDLPLKRNEASQPTCNQISAHEASQFPEHHLSHRSPRLRLLDVGAGDGAVTAELAPLFAEVLATEVSGPCVRAIRRRGIACECTADLSKLAPQQWDVVSCLNVLDRCSRPLDLLSDLRLLTTPETGRVLLAVVFPFRPWVECGGMGRRKPPEQILPVDARAGWEESVKQLNSRVIEPAGFKIHKISRVPYLCQGDPGAPVYILDDAVFVLSVV